MDIFKVHDSIINDYQTYIESFVNIKNDYIKKKVADEISSGKLWPRPLIQFNPSYKPGRSVSEMIDDGLLHNEIGNIFKGYNLYEHQVEAITLGSKGKNFVVTSGTGSGKSLTFLGTIFNYLLNNKPSKGIKAIIIYPMNALINSQNEEITKFKKLFEEETGKDFPISYAQYTGQEKEDDRKKVWDNLPDIILTNYMMLELILTRLGEEGMRKSIYKSLKYVVFDELHTYRGRQGSDVGLLIRRLKAKCNNSISCIGTSATMISGGTIQDQKKKVAEVASTFFGAKFEPDQIIIESLVPSLSLSRQNDLKPSVIDVIIKGIDKDAGYIELLKNSLAQWLEKQIALKELDDGMIVRNKPMTIEQIIQALIDFTGLPNENCSKAIEDLLQWIAGVNVMSDKNANKTILPFKLHQFISQTGSVYLTLDKENKDKILTLQAGVYISKDDGDKKPIYPVVFSRESGHEYICVTKNPETKKLDPREFSDWNVNEEEEGEGNLSGYLLFGENIWEDEEIRNLPDAWLNPKGDKVIKKYRDRMPKKIWFNELGQYSEMQPLNIGGWQLGWFMSHKLLFDPTSGTFYDARTSEGTKLTKLGSEGRSTSTTILSFNILRQLAEAGYHEQKQKVLSFTDNRQDAALQSGHFNDFIQTLHLRTGINSAVHAGEKGYLEFAEIGDCIFTALDLKQDDYAISMAEFAGPRKENENALKDFLIYKVLYDLRRSWRVVLPNLEQCGLLKITYKYMEETLEDPEFINQIKTGFVGLVE
ncbi:MAG: DEAD/DEAH box helicase [Bacteroidales bacterium]|nr:DEAD/DEAH box helicase [Bacteroidales bacterium]